MADKLNVTRNQLANFIKEPEMIRQMELVFDYVRQIEPKPESGEGGGTGFVRDAFETVSQNMESLDRNFTYDGEGRLTSVVGIITASSSITKSLNYNERGRLESIVLSGNTPTGINLRKNLTYDGDGRLSSIQYIAE